MSTLNETTTDTTAATDQTPVLNVARPLSDFRKVRTFVDIQYVVQLGWKAAGYVMQMLD